MSAAALVLDVWVASRVLANRPVDSDLGLVSDSMRGLVEELAKTAPTARVELLSARASPEFAEAVIVTDPDGDRPDDGWPPVGTHIPEASPFPLDVLPLGLARLAIQGAKAYQCPPDYFAAPALALAGGAVGRSVELRVSATYAEAADLTVAVVGPAGAKKSPPLRLLLGPFYDADREMRDTYVRERDEHRRAMRAWEAAKKRGIDAGDEPVAPVHGHATIDDATRESVARVAADNPRGVVLAQDELASWVESLDAYRSGRGGDRQFWLKVRSGSLVKVTRKGSPDPIVIPRPMIPVVGCLTPSNLPALAQGRDDGWLDRIMFSYPEPSRDRLSGYTDAEIDPALVRDWTEAVLRLRTRPMMIDAGGHPQPCFVKLTPGAREAWRCFVDGHHLEQRDPNFDPAFGGPWSKLEGYTLRMALILSQLHWAYDPTAETGRPPDVTRKDVEGGWRLCDYFKSSFRKVRAELMGGAPDPDVAAVIAWVAKSGVASFTANEVNESLGRFRGDLRRRDAAINRLEAAHAIRRKVVPDRPGPGRKTKERFEVNPYLSNSGYSANRPIGPDSLNTLNGDRNTDSAVESGGADA